MVTFYIIFCLKLIPIHPPKHYALLLSYKKFLLQPKWSILCPQQVSHAFAHTVSPYFTCMSSPSLHCLPQYYSSSKPRSDPLFEAQSSLLLLKYLCRLVHTALLPWCCLMTVPGKQLVDIWVPIMGCRQLSRFTVDIDWFLFFITFRN